VSVDGNGSVGNAEVLTTIGRRLKALRKSNNLSQREVADAIGLPQSNLSRIENGKQRLNLTVLSGMLSIYQTSIQEFFSREDGGGEAGQSPSTRERQMLESVRRLSPEDRREVEGYIDFKLFRARRDRHADAEETS
jgi:transcriptional regulator with XRE-family HTH domain